MKRYELAIPDGLLRRVDYQAERADRSRPAQIRHLIKVGLAHTENPGDITGVARSAQTERG